MNLQKELQQQDFIIKKAEEFDTDSILFLIQEQARFENGLDECVITIDQIKKYCFGPKKYIETYLGFHQNQPVGLLMFYFFFSGKLGKPGIYLDEIHVLEKERRKGFGKKLLDYMVNFAKSNDYEFILWRTQEWNKGAINFYKQNFADIIPYHQLRIDKNLIDKISYL